MKISGSECPEEDVEKDFSFPGAGQRSWSLRSRERVTPVGAKHLSYFL